MLAYIGLFWTFAIITVQAGKWGPWKDITRCDDIPCGCFEGQVCSKRGEGEVVQIRNCDMSDGKSCHFEDNEGMIRKKKCTNSCPGWSKPILISCDCELNEGYFELRCDNPPPVQDGPLCTKFGEEKGDSMTDIKKDECNCTDELWVLFNATTPAPTARPASTQSVIATTMLPCCNSSEYFDEYDGYNGDEGNAAEMNDFLNDDEGTTTTMSYEMKMYEDMITRNHCRICPEDEHENGDNVDDKKEIENISEEIDVKNNGAEIDVVNNSSENDDVENNGAEIDVENNGAEIDVENKKDAEEAIPDNDAEKDQEEEDLYYAY